MALFTSSYSPQLRIEVVVSLRGLGQEIADMICQLSEYIEGLVTSMDPEAQEPGHVREWINWILEKMKEFWRRVASAARGVESWLGEAFSSAEEKISKALEMATDLVFGVKASIYEALDGLKAKIRELHDSIESEGEEKTKEEEAKEEEPDEGYEVEDDEDSKNDGPSAKRIRLF